MLDNYYRVPSFEPSSNKLTTFTRRHSSKASIQRGVKQTWRQSNAGPHHLEEEAAPSDKLYVSRTLLMLPNYLRCNLRNLKNVWFS